MFVLCFGFFLNFLFIFYSFFWSLVIGWLLLGCSFVGFCVALMFSFSRYDDWCYVGVNLVEMSRCTSWSYRFPFLFLLYCSLRINLLYLEFLLINKLLSPLHKKKKKKKNLMLWNGCYAHLILSRFLDAFGVSLVYNMLFPLARRTPFSSQFVFLILFWIFGLRRMLDFLDVWVAKEGY